MITWKEDAGIDGWTGDLGEQWVLEITPHSKGGWSWAVLTDDADQKVPEGWDPTLEDAMVHSESAYLDWRDIIEGRKAVPDEHDETADIVADAIAQERAAVVAWLREAGHSGALDVEVTGVPVSERERAILSRVVTMALCEAANLMDSGEHRREEEL